MNRPGRSILTFTICFFTVELLFALLLGFLSFYTGQRSELPKWNGWDYLLFCIREGLFIGSPFALLAGILGGLAALFWPAPPDRQEE